MNINDPHDKRTRTDVHNNLPNGKGTRGGTCVTTMTAKQHKRFAITGELWKGSRQRGRPA